MYHLPTGTASARRYHAHDGVLDEIRLAGRVQTPVLITGRRRAERERIARLIHAVSDRGVGRFVKCRHDAALRPRFERARGGTLFIDDIASLSRPAQTLLFSLLEDGVRVIAGASRHLDADRADGAFSEPLFYRLNVIHIDRDSL